MPLSEVSLPAIPVLTGIPSTPENITSIGEDHDKLPDLVSKQGSNNNTEVGNNKENKINTEPKATFNVQRLSTEEEMDAVDALLSLSTLHDNSVDQLTENKILMPIGGGNLPIDVAQVDHAIAKMTKQEEEGAAAKCTINENNVTPVNNTSKPVSVVIGDDQPHASQSNGDNEFSTSEG